MMKKIVAMFLAVAALISLLAACGGENTPGGNGVAQKDPGYQVPSGGYDGSKVTIKFAHTMGDKLQKVLEKHIAEFNKLYPNIHIEHSSYGAWRDISGQINTEMAADNQPNVAYCYPDHVAMYNMANAVITLDGLIASTEPALKGDGSTEPLGLNRKQIDDFIDSFYNEGMAYGDGLMYTMPMSKSTEVLYYNKTFFDANGLTVPTTWEEMETVCQKILELDPKSIPLGYDSEDNWFITMCEQYGYDYTSATGEEHYLFNNDKNKSFVKMLRNWHQKGYVTTETIYGAYTSSLFTQLDKSVSHSYMCIGSTGGASYQVPADKAFEVGVAPIPQVNPNDKKSITQGPNLCILKSRKTTDQHILASWLFVKYLTTNLSFQTDFSEASGYMPVLETVGDDKDYVDWLSKADGYDFLVAKVIKVGLEEAESYFVSPAFNGSSEARKQVGALLSKCMSEKTDNVDALIDSAFQNAYDECVFLTG